MISYKVNHPLMTDTVIKLYKYSSNGNKNIIHSEKTISKMLKNSDFIVTAWDKKNLVGILRVITDYVSIAFLLGLAVDINYQNKGIGRQLIHLVENKLEPTTQIILLSAPQTNDFYLKMGFNKNSRCWTKQIKNQNNK